MTTITNWLGAIAVAMALGTAYHLDGPSELEAAIDTASARTEAIRQEQSRQRIERAAQRSCGENAYFQVLDKHTVQCFTKRGLRTSKVAL